jgi:enamine deaminase RidA (YjgF/YER057c/UK114 family)
MGKVDDRLAELGITLPEAQEPIASYVPAVRAGDLVQTSAQLPMVDGRLLHAGTVGGSLTPEQGAAAARACALNALAAIRGLIGDLDRVERVVKLTGWIACGEDFQAQSAVMNGASEVVGQIFGEAGKHARAAVGVNSLPLGSAVLVEMTVKLR